MTQHLPFTLWKLPGGLLSRHPTPESAELDLHTRALAGERGMFQIGWHSIVVTTVGVSEDGA